MLLALVGEARCLEAEFMNVKNFVEVSEFSDLRFLYTMFTLQTSFKSLLLWGGGGVKIR
jgi:hypothetical protein